MKRLIMPAVAALGVGTLAFIAHQVDNRRPINDYDKCVARYTSHKYPLLSSIVCGGPHQPQIKK
jgi:hypothetical protein